MSDLDIALWKIIISNQFVDGNEGLVPEVDKNLILDNAKQIVGQVFLDCYHAELQALSSSGNITDDVISYKAWKAARRAAGVNDND